MKARTPDHFSLCLNPCSLLRKLQLQLELCTLGSAPSTSWPTTLCLTNDTETRELDFIFQFDSHTRPPIFSRVSNN